MKINESDWKVEKHAPVIELKKEGEDWIIEVSVGKEIPHPNTYEHHIKWIEVYFEDELGNLYPIGRAQFEGHGEKGLTEPRALFLFKSKGKGKITALSFCNIHGMWKNSLEVE